MNDVRLLAIETSSRRGSVALGDGPTLVAAAEFSADTRHAVELLPTIDRLFAAHAWDRASLRQVYVSVGPGSFTGLRVAVTAARHLALALDVRIVSVPSLAVIADNALRLPDPPPRVAVVLDAKRKQVYAGLFERRGQDYEPVGPPVVEDPGHWLASLPRPLIVMGEGVTFHREAIAATGLPILDDDHALPRAESVHRLGWKLALAGRFTPARELVPLYLRRPEAEEIWERRQREAVQIREGSAARDRDPRDGVR